MVDWNHTPSLPIESAPLFRRPPHPKTALIYWLKGWRPLAVRFWLLITAFGLWRWTSPSIDEAADLSLGWIASLWLRNMAVVLIAAGAAHLYLYTFHRQGDDLKYDSRPMGRNKRIFLFNNQVWDNMFLTLGPAIAIGTAWEALMWWSYANGRPFGWSNMITLADNPVWSIILVALIPLWAALYFSLHHWVLHRRLVYRHIHSWHHRNVNIGPWSGLAMHPAEQFVLYSDVLLLLVIPSHPVHLLFLMLHHTIGAPLSHTGYDAIKLPGGTNLGVGDFHHQLHHRFIECNYGAYESPLDELIDAFHDGTTEGDRKIAERRKQLTTARTQRYGPPT